VHQDYNNKAEEVK